MLTIAGATNKEVWSRPGYGSYQEITVSLPAGARVKIFRDGGDKYCSRREYRQALISKNLFFVVAPANSKVKIKGDGVQYKGEISGARDFSERRGGSGKWKIGDCYRRPPKIKR